MSTENETPVLFMQVKRPSYQSDYGTITFETKLYNSAEDKLSGFGYTADLNIAMLSDVLSYAQYHIRQCSSHMPDWKLYAIKTSVAHYDGLNLEQAEMAVRVLRKIDKVFTAYAADFGRIESYALHVQLVCKALGIKTIVTRSNRTGGSQNMEFITWKVSDIPYLIDQEMLDAQKEIASL